MSTSCGFGKAGSNDTVSPMPNMLSGSVGLTDAELTAVVAGPTRIGPVCGVHIETRAVDPIVIAQALGEAGGLIDEARAGPVPFHFLQRDDVRALDFAHDAIEVEAAVLAATVLNVVGDETQRTPSYRPEVSTTRRAEA